MKKTDQLRAEISQELSDFKYDNRLKLREMSEATGYTMETISNAINRPYKLKLETLEEILIEVKK